MEHEFYKCSCGDELRCPTCQGLLTCTVCNGAEASLTKDCCGRPLTEEEDARIGDIDYVNGMWVDFDKDCRIEHYRNPNNDFLVGVSITHINSGMNIKSHVCKDLVNNLYIVKKELLNLLTQLPRGGVYENKRGSSL